jgi:hypothetical protein
MSDDPTSMSRIGKQMPQRERDEMAAARQLLSSVVVPPAPDTEAARAYGYLSRLFVSCAPQCTPLPDLMGVCTQIDNLICGYLIRLGEMPDPASPAVASQSAA